MLFVVAIASIVNLVVTVYVARKLATMGDKAKEGASVERAMVPSLGDTLERRALDLQSSTFYRKRS